MHFDVRPLSEHMIKPVHNFSGDELVAENDYKQSIFVGYVSTVSTLYGAAVGHKIDLTTDTFERWKRITSSAGLIDDAIDDGPTKQVDLAVYLQQTDASSESMPPTNISQSHNLSVAGALLKNCTEGMSESQIIRLQNAAHKIGLVALAKNNCSELDSYKKLLLEESLATAALIYESPDASVRNQTGYSQFIEWCIYSFAFATFVDSGRDLRRDYKNEITKVSPTLGNSTILFNQALLYARHLYKQKDQLKASMSAIRYRSRYSKMPTKRTMKKYKKQLV